MRGVFYCQQIVFEEKPGITMLVRAGLQVNEKICRQAINTSVASLYCLFDLCHQEPYLSQVVSIMLDDPMNMFIKGHFVNRVNF